ncbi:MAG: asparaginase [Xanthobacteraceae bacterium]|nr:asparaginase [Xanthobacteraceae bacterium]
MTLPTILMISLGGTITMTQGASGGVVPTLDASDLVRTVPGLDAVAKIETLPLLRKPSGSLSLNDLMATASLLNERLGKDIAGAVVIQGTDTIEESAFVLDLLLAGDAPVVVTGAMRSPEAAGADGPANLLASAIVAASPDARGRGTLVVLNDEIHAARFVQKSHTALPSAFRSPLCGPIGLVTEGRAQFQLNHHRNPTSISALSNADRPVALLKISLGDDGRMISALPSLGFAGAVVESMGAGHVPADIVPLLSALTEQIPVILASRVNTGPTFTRTYGFPGSEIDLIGHGMIPAGALSGLKARLLLALLLRSGSNRTHIRTAFERY